ncbi:adenosine monophosphate deaminase [Cryptosporidium ubiquitum]|uniref:Adenosine monophosphate deaminase n=1 Tax=Cryptosporidium ubiquitum TaxID=857276 RepID=A0A1J4MEW2_9CRYT|nr:adenosine monophosphate deaminase [Cryptosporidium ubiquitum]OII72011.1 adenosine monophosphate deaminase [Cryptosporidium ubiquitum]
MIIEQKSGDEIKKLTGRSIIWSPNELGIPYLGLYEEHGKIGDEDYLRYGVRYIGNKAINGNNERIIIGEIYGELLSLDSLAFKSKEYEYTELNSSLNWIWKYNGVVIDTRNITGILGFIQKTWKESDESNCHLEVIDGRLYVTSNPNVCIYPGDELVLSVNNNMDLLIPTIGDEVMKLRSRSRRLEQKLERFNCKESPKSCEATAVSVSSVSTAVTKNKSGMNDEYDNSNNSNHIISVPYSLNCTNEYYCNLCNRSHNNTSVTPGSFYYGEFRFSTRIFKNALVFVLGEKENTLNLTENQIHYFDRWKSTSCDRELYNLNSVHKISFKPKKGVSIESIQNENENDQNCNLPIEILLVKNYISKNINEMIISEFQLVRDDISHNFGDLTRKCYISQSVLLYYFFEKWMNEKFIGEYKYLRIPIPMLIEQHRQLLLPYPEGIQWNLETLSWRYNIQKNNRIYKQEMGTNFPLEASINDHLAQEQEYIGVRVTNENDSFELFKNYITICSIKYKGVNNSKHKELNPSACNYNSNRTDTNIDYQSNLNGNKKKRQKEIEDLKNKEYENELFEIEARDISRKNANNFSDSPKNNDLVNIHEIIDRCSEIKSLDHINNTNKQILTAVSDDIGVISQQVEILLVPPYSSFIKFCVKRLGFSITYNKRRAWFSVRSRGVLEAFNLAIKWIKKQKSMTQKNHSNNFVEHINKYNMENISSPNNLSINSKSGINGKRSSQKISNYINNNNAHLTFVKIENNNHFCQDSDADSVLSLNEQANRLKPLPKRIIWVPSRRVFIVSYKRLGAINQMNTKSFNPTIYGGVKKALKHACIFQSQTEQCKYSGFGESSGITEKNSSYTSIQGKMDNFEEKSRMDSSLKPINYWVKSIDSKVSPEKVTNAYREAVSTYLTQSTSFSQSNAALVGLENYCEANLEQNNVKFLSETSNLKSSEEECANTSYVVENSCNNNENIDVFENQVQMKIDESYINNFNTDYVYSGESNRLKTLNENSSLNKGFEAHEHEYSQNIEFKPFKMYHDQVFLNKDSMLNLMNIDEVLNLHSSNVNNLQNDSTDGQTVILDEETCSTENLVCQESLCTSNVTDYMNFFEDYKITEPLISISDPYTNIVQLDDPPTLHDQYIKMVSPYDYIDSFTLIEP